MKIPLMEALKQMPYNVKFMKDLVTKNRMVSFKTVHNMLNYSAITSQSLVEKKENLGAFTILCIIGSFNFARVLCDMGASINFILLVIYK